MLKDKEGISREERQKYFVQKYEESDMSKRHLIEDEYEKEALTNLQESNISQFKYIATWSAQFKILLKRTLKGLIRQKDYIITRNSLQIYFAVIGLILYWDVFSYKHANAIDGKNNAARFSDKNRLHFLYRKWYYNDSITNDCFGLYFFDKISKLKVPEERAVFMRDQASSLYGVSPYFISRILCEIPFVIIDTLLLGLISYWAVGLNNSDSSKFLIFCFLLCY